MKPLNQYFAIFGTALCLCTLGCEKPAEGGNGKPTDTTKTVTEPTVEATSSSSNQFLFVSDVHYGADQVNKKDDYSTDTGPILWKAAQTKMKSLFTTSTPPQFVIYTGDLPAHYEGATSHGTCPAALTDTKGDSTLTDHKAALKTVLEDLYGILPAGVPMFYAPGNNDAISGDYFSFADASQNTPFELVAKSDNYPAPNAHTPCGKAPCMVSNPDPKHGYYTAKATDNLRIIALNSVILNGFYCEVDGVKHEKAGDTMMNWFGKQLDAAATAGDKVYIIMHIPPNKWSRNEDWKTTFLTDIEAHDSIISGIMYGHTHMDEVLLFHGVKNRQKVTEVGISCPGITPLHANNPGFKTVSYQPGTMELAGFDTYWTTPDASDWGHSTYSFSKYYAQGSQPTIYDALKNTNNFDSKAILKNMHEVYWVMHPPSKKDEKWFPTSIDVY